MPGNKSEFDHDRLDRCARMYPDNVSAGVALGIHASSFGRLCRKFGVETPDQRKRVRKKLAARGM
jgi:hypothetical protein